MVIMAVGQQGLGRTKLKIVVIEWRSDADFFNIKAMVSSLNGHFRGVAKEVFDIIRTSV